MSNDRIKVKRDGPRGWHWIARANFDPSVHELVEGEAAPVQVEVTIEPKVTVAAKRGRAKK